MASPVEILGNVKGMMRDVGVDRMPKGFVWDLKDYIPNRKGANLELRGPWPYFGATDYGNQIWGGRYTRFLKGSKLMINADSQIWDVGINTGTGVSVGAGPAAMVQNPVKLRDRVYWPEGTGTTTPYVTTYDGGTITIANLPASATKAKVALAYKDRLVVAGDPDNPADVVFSPLEIDGGPLVAWDPLSKIGTTAEVTGLAGMPGQILVFHPSMVERIHGSIPPGADLQSDMYVDTLTDQVGCTEPQTIVSWRENIIWADERGVFLTEGATVRNIIEQGHMGDIWRSVYGNKVSGASVSCGVFFDYLCVSIVTLGNEYPVTFVCDLNTRSWMRFSNFAGTCYIPSEGPEEEQYCGNYFSHKLMRLSPMFTGALTEINPPPDHIDGNGTPVKGRVITGFMRLADEEGMQRVRDVRISYSHHSYVTPLQTQGIQVYYRTTPPTPEELDLNDPSNVVGWTSAGFVPDALPYSRKKLAIGKRCFGVMLRIDSASNSRTSRIYSVGILTTAQDRGKVTT